MMRRPSFLALSSYLLVNFIKAEVRAQTLGHDDAVGRLVVLQQGGHDARQGQGRAVEGVAELHLAVLVLEAQLHAVGLEGLEVGDRADLEPAFLRGTPHLEVEGHGRGEADVAAAELEDMVRQAQLVEQAAHMFLHLLEHIVTAVGMLDDDDFHLRELVQAVQSADILAVAAGLAAETLAVTHALDGQLLGVDHLATEDISDGYLSGGNHIEAVEGDGIHLALLVGQLAGAETRSLVDHQRRLNLQEAGVGGLVEEEVDEGALEAGTLALVEGKAGASHLVSQLKVDDIVLGAEVPVGKRVGGQVRLMAELGHHHVVGLALAAGHGDMGGVGQRDELLVEFLLGGGLLGREFLTFCFHLSTFRFLGLGLVLLALFHQHADFLGNLVRLGLHAVGLHLEGAALLVELQNLGDALFNILYILDLQSGNDFLSMILDIL